MQKWQKICIAALSLIGVSLVAWGMTYNKNAIFIAGLVVVALSYGIIRKFLKDSISNRDN